MASAASDFAQQSGEYVLVRGGGRGGRKERKGREEGEGGEGGRRGG